MLPDFHTCSTCHVVKGHHQLHYEGRVHIKIQKKYIEFSEQMCLNYVTRLLNFTVI